MRRRKDFKRLEGTRSARLVVIAAEGRWTENIYFEAMKKVRCASGVHVEILHRDSDNSSPDSVMLQVKNFIAEYNIEDDDQLWIVVDKDKWKDKMLKVIAQNCVKNSNLNFCVSNPCFELWLLLHVEDVMSYSPKQWDMLAKNKKASRHGDTWLKKRMKKLIGHYHESDYDAISLIGNVNDAINRAKALDVCSTDRWPRTVGTRVYLLAQSIMGLTV